MGDGLTPEGDIPPLIAEKQPDEDPVLLAVARAKMAEGFRPLPYHDSQGYLTIGYGCNLDAGWSEGMAAQVLDFQMRQSEQQLHNYPWYAQLGTVRRSVVAEMCFNMGLGKLLGFHDTIGAISRQDWQSAHDGMLDSVWAKQVGQRATNLAELMLKGA